MERNGLGVEFNSVKTAVSYALIGLPLGFLVGMLHGKQIASLGVLVIAGLLIGAAIGTWRRKYAEKRGRTANRVFRVVLRRQEENCADEQRTNNDNGENCLDQVRH